MGKLIICCCVFFTNFTTCVNHNMDWKYSKKPVFFKEGAVELYDYIEKKTSKQLFFHGVDMSKTHVSMIMDNVFFYTVKDDDWLFMRKLDDSSLAGLTKVNIKDVRRLNFITPHLFLITKKDEKKSKLLFLNENKQIDTVEISCPKLEVRVTDVENINLCLVGNSIFFSHENEIIEYDYINKASKSYKISNNVKRILNIILVDSTIVGQYLDFNENVYLFTSRMFTFPFLKMVPTNQVSYMWNYAHFKYENRNYLLLRDRDGKWAAGAGKYYTFCIESGSIEYLPKLSEYFVAFKFMGFI